MTATILLFPGTYHPEQTLKDQYQQLKDNPKPVEYRCVKNGCGSNRMINWSDGVVTCAKCEEISQIIRCYAVATLGFDDGA